MTHVNEFDYLPDMEIPIPEHDYPGYVDENFYLFVYGTMMPGQRNETRLYDLGAKYVGPTTTKHYYYMKTKISQHGYYAPVLFPNGNNIVHGHVYSLTDGAIRQIDIYEGSPLIYKRTLIEINMEPKFVHAYLYGISEYDDLYEVGVVKNDSGVSFDGNI